MPKDEERVNKKRIKNQGNRKNMKWVEEIQKEKVENWKDPVFFPVGRKHEPGKENGLSDVASGPSDIHSVHLTKPGGNFGIDNRI
jgi:hypothetical protein